VREQGRDDLGVENGAAGRDPLQGVDQVVEPGDPVLEQVPQSGAAAEQVLGVGLLDVLRQDQHPGSGHPPTQLQGRAQALVGERRRHPDVHDGHVRTVLVDGGHEGEPVRDRGHDGRSRLVEQADEPLPQQRGVLGQDHAHLDPHPDRRDRRDQGRGPTRR
jgi:hypothetical protein